MNRNRDYSFWRQNDQHRIKEYYMWGYQVNVVSSYAEQNE